MPVDPRLNCASEVCCPPQQQSPSGEQAAYAGPAMSARIDILIDLGVSEDAAPSIAKKMAERGIAFLSAELATAIRHIAFPDEGDGKG